MDVLAVDVDPQAGLTAALEVEPQKPTLYEVLHGRAHAADPVCATAIQGLALLPSDLDLAGAELELPSLGRWDHLLRRALAGPVREGGSLFTRLLDPSASHGSRTGRSWVVCG